MSIPRTEPSEPCGPSTFGSGNTPVSGCFVPGKSCMGVTRQALVSEGPQAADGFTRELSLQRVWKWPKQTSQGRQGQFSPRTEQEVT